MYTIKKIHSTQVKTVNLWVCLFPTTDMHRHCSELGTVLTHTVINLCLAVDGLPLFYNVGLVSCSYYHLLF